MIVYRVIHTLNEIYDDDIEAFKDIGVFSSKKAAEDAIAKVVEKPGFRDHKSGFRVYEIVLDECEWIDGFVTDPSEMDDPSEIDTKDH